MKVACGGMWWHVVARIRDSEAIRVACEHVNFHCAHVMHEVNDGVSGMSEYIAMNET